MGCHGLNARHRRRSRKPFMKAGSMRSLGVTSRKVTRYKRKISILIAVAFNVRNKLASKLHRKPGLRRKNREPETCDQSRIILILSFLIPDRVIHLLVPCLFWERSSRNVIGASFAEIRSDRVPDGLSLSS